MSQGTKDDLFLLGYSQLWLEVGILSETKLSEQLLELQRGQITNTEHYRYNTLIKYIQEKNQFSDAELNNFFLVVGSESDLAVAGSVLAALLAKECLSRGQFDVVVAFFSKYGEWTTKITRRHSLIRELKSTVLTDEIFDRCLIDGDKYVHSLLLELIPQEKIRLKRLAEKAANNQIRNQANQLLQKKIASAKNTAESAECYKQVWE